LDVFNLNGEHDWDAENDRDGYRHRRAVIGKRLGSGGLLGGTVYEVPPGEKTWPYHYELGCEEWLVVVSGRPTLRGPDGERELEPGDVAVFPSGPQGAHGVENRTSETCRVLLLSSKSPVAIVHYPDSGKVGLWVEGEDYVGMVRNAPELDYWDGEA
jgi:uncharacterized cupin superfamily protein